MTPVDQGVTVVNITRCPDFGTLVGDCYIGRQFLYNGRHFRASKYANPYRIAKGCTRTHALAQYRDYLYSSGLAYEVQRDFAGVKRIGCWCAPEPCHGDILAHIARHGADAFRRE